jgi:hypothetical protein
MVVGFKVDAGQDRPRPHSPEEPDSGDPAACADLHYCLGSDGGREEPQRHAGQRCDRHRAADPVGIRARRLQRFVFAGEFVDDYSGVSAEDGCLR